MLRYRLSLKEKIAVLGPRPRPSERSVDPKSGAIENIAADTGLKLAEGSLVEKSELEPGRQIGISRKLLLEHRL